MRALPRVLLGLALAVALGLALAAALRPLAGPRTIGQQVLAIAADLKCPVCAGESAAVSQSAQSIAMRAQIQADLQAGMGRRRIEAQFVAEYGPWILYRPPGRGPFALLWLLPAAAVAAVSVGVWRHLSGRLARRGDAESRVQAQGEPGADLQRRLRRFL